MTKPFDFKSQLYSRKPIAERDGIPIFSSQDAYIENYEKIAADHVSKITSGQENPFMEEELWVSLEASTREYIRQYVASGSKILDIGVGLGRLLEPLEEYERYGVDISIDYLSIAKSRGIEVALAKIEELPYKSEFFDAIVICDVLEHVVDLNLCCEKILTCLRPGGVLIVRVPFKEDLDAYLNENLPYEFIHLRNFDEPGLRLHFQKIFGLHFLEASQTTHYLQGTPRLKVRLLPEEVRKQMEELAKLHPEIASVASAFEVSEEAFQTWMYHIKEHSKELFNDISTRLIYGIDINIAFTKPFDANPRLRSIRDIGSQKGWSEDRTQDETMLAIGRDFLQFSNETRKRLKTLDEKIESYIESNIQTVDSTVRSEFLDVKMTLVKQGELINLISQEIEMNKSERESRQKTLLRRAVRKLQSFLNITD